MTGRHAHERVPQRHPFDPGQWVREAWGGRPGHDAATVLCAGVPGFGFRHGRVWGVHLAWSGNQVLSAENSTTGWRLLRGGELLLPREGVIGPGESYSSPWLFASWGEGLDEFAGRFHAFLRARPQHPRHPRPVVLNTWEAVYFDHDLAKLLDLAERAASIGHRAVRAGRRLVPRTSRRHGGAGRLAGRRARVAGRADAAGRPRPRARHGLRPVVRAGDGQPRLRPRAGAPRLALPDRARARAGQPLPARPRPGAPGGLCPRPREHLRAGRGVRHRLPQVGPQPATGGRRPRAHRSAGRPTADPRRLSNDGRS